MNKNNDDLVLKVLLEDFKARRDEINAFIDATFSVSNLSFLGIGTLLAIASYLNDNDLTGVFALFSIVFFTLLWIQLRLNIQVIHLCNYISQKISPEARLILRQSTGKDYDFIFSWESKGRKQLHSFNLWLFPIVGARYGIPLLAAMSSFFTFISTLDKSGFPEQINYILVGINLFSLIYSVIAIFYVRKVLKSDN